MIDLKTIPDAKIAWIPTKCCDGLAWLCRVWVVENGPRKIKWKSLGNAIVCSAGLRKLSKMMLEPDAPGDNVIPTWETFVKQGGGLSREKYHELLCLSGLPLPFDKAPSQELPYTEGNEK